VRPVALAAATLGLTLAGCGLKGPLALPEKSGPVTIRPAPPPTAPAPQGTEAPATESVETTSPPAVKTPPEP
jgi:predicted small lipoprotein YifL